MKIITFSRHFLFLLLITQSATYAATPLQPGQKIEWKSLPQQANFVVLPSTLLEPQDTQPKNIRFNCLFEKYILGEIAQDQKLTPQEAHDWYKYMYEKKYVFEEGYERNSSMRDYIENIKNIEDPNLYEYVKRYKYRKWLRMSLKRKKRQKGDNKVLRRIYNGSYAS